METLVNITQAIVPYLEFAGRVLILLIIVAAVIYSARDLDND